MFNHLFSTYELVDPPPIITEGYKAVQDIYEKYKNLEVPQIMYDQDTFQEEKPFEVSTDNSIRFVPINKQQDILGVSKVIPTILKQQKMNNNSQVQGSSFKDKEDYTKTLYKYLYKALEDNGIDGNTWAPILTAHTSIESNWGNEFSRKNNNFAGIKGAGSGKVNTKEYDPSIGYYTVKSSFKSYPSIEDFADDYVKRLKSRFNAFQGSPSEYLKNIKSKGYFTDSLPKYEKMLDTRLKSILDLLNS